MKKINLILFLSIFLFTISLIIYQSNSFRYYSGYIFEKIPGPIKPNYSSIDKIFNNLDIFKSLFINSNENRIDLQLSSSDLQEFQREKNIFSQIGYQKDSEKKWRKAKFISEGNLFKTKVKLQGTSIRGGNKSDDSFKLKLDEDGSYFQGMRRFNLIYAQEEAPLSVITPNFMAREKGLISPIGDYVNLFINGIFQSTYYLSDGLSKEILEEHYKITDYAIFKPNDDWDRMRPGHSSHADLSIGNMEISGSNSNAGHSMSRMEDFFESIKEKTIFNGESFVDFDYFSKFLAIHVLTSETHNAAGDNLRLMLNLRNGKIYPIFRNEGNSITRLNSLRMNSDRIIENFNRLWFYSSYSEDNAPALDLYKQFIQNGNLRSKRDNYLHSYLSEDSYIKILRSEWEKNENILKSGKIPRRSVSFDYWANEQHYSKVASLAKQYLDYSKLFIVFDHKKNKLIIETDTFQPIHIKKIDYFDSFGLENTIEIDELIQAPDLNKDLRIIEEKNIIQLENNKDIRSIKKIYAKNMTTNSYVDFDDIYISNFDFSYFENKNYLDVLKKSNVIFDIQKNIISIKEGQYLVSENIIFPEGLKLVIEPGVNLTLLGSILVRGGLDIQGEVNKNVKINLNTKELNSSFIVLGSGVNNIVQAEHVVFSGGSDTYIMGVHSSGSFMVDNSNVRLSNIKIQNSLADDGLNLRNSQIYIENSIFSDNSFDQVDIDYSQGVIKNNLFSGIYSLEGDGLDLSGSLVNVLDNKFQKFQDKALSVGEKTIVCANGNSFKDSKIGIASKDASKVFLKDNEYFDVENISLAYIKKKMYQKPGVINNFDSNDEVNCL